MANRLGIIALIAALGAAAYAFWPDDGGKLTNYPSGGRGVVAFGDSLVEGVGATEGNDFVSVLSRNAGVPIVNLGRSGDTTEDGLARVDSIVGRKPEAAIILLGGNDFLRKVPVSETFGNLARIIEKVHSSGAVVVLLGVRGGILNDEYEREFERLAETYGTAYVPDVLDGVITDRSLMSDAIHPNDRGYELIAEKVESELLRAIR